MIKFKLQPSEAYKNARKNIKRSIFDFIKKKSLGFKKGSKRAQWSRDVVKGKLNESKMLTSLRNRHMKELREFIGLEAMVSRQSLNNSLKRRLERVQKSLDLKKRVLPSHKFEDIQKVRGVARGLTRRRLGAPIHQKLQSYSKKSLTEAEEKIQGLMDIRVLDNSSMDRIDTEASPKAPIADWRPPRKSGIVVDNSNFAVSGKGVVKGVSALGDDPNNEKQGSLLNRDKLEDRRVLVAQNIALNLQPAHKSRWKRKESTPKLVDLIAPKKLRARYKTRSSKSRGGRGSKFSMRSTLKEGTRTRSSVEIVSRYKKPKEGKGGKEKNSETARFGGAALAGGGGLGASENAADEVEVGEEVLDPALGDLDEFDRKLKKKLRKYERNAKLSSWSASFASYDSMGIGRVSTKRRGLAGR